LKGLHWLISLHPDRQEKREAWKPPRPSRRLPVCCSPAAIVIVIAAVNADASLVLLF
jgi:hypothetical protein